MSTLLEQASLVLIPSGYKEDIVYSQIPTNGNGDLSFTRASNGTRVNSAGLVEVTPWNLLQQSEALNTTWSDFGTGVTVTANATTAPNGTSTADKLEFPTSTGSAQYVLGQIVNVEVGVPYTFSFWAKAVSGTITNLVVRINGAEAVLGETITTEWQRFTKTLTPTTASDDTGFKNRNSVSGSGTAINVYIWGAQLNIGSTAKPYFPTTDRLNVPRLTYQNGGGGCPSLLLEKQSTNLVSYSEDFTNAYWGTLNSTITPNNTISPDGTQNADKFVENNGTGSKWVYSTPIVTAGSVYTYSIFAKKGERDFIYINAYSNANLRAWFNLNTGTIGATNAGVSAKIENYGNGWYKCSVTITAAIGVQFYLLGVSNANNVEDYTGDGTSGIYIWGAQGEQSSYPTSYIPTTTASATRVADLDTTDTIQTAQTFAGDFTFFVDFVSFTTTDGPGPTNQMILGGGNQALGASYKSYFWVTQGAIILTGDSETTMIAVNKVFNANQRYKLLVKRNGTTIKVFCDGVQVGSSATSSLSISIRSIGWSYSASYRFNGLINEVVLSATGFSDSDCQALTTI
jgi:hypothetical protein